MTDDLSKYNDYQLHMLLMNAEDDGKHAKAMLQAGREDYRPKHAALQAKWKAIKGEMKNRANPAPATVAAPAAAPAPLTPKQFHNMCYQHDWAYEHSDDSGTYRAGKESAARIANALRAQPELTPIFQEWRAHIVAHGKIPKEPE